MSETRLEKDGCLRVPEELLSVLGWDENTALYMRKSGGGLRIEPKQRYCLFCGVAADPLVEVREGYICKPCLHVALENL